MRMMKNYLKTGFLLLGILISTTNCEKAEFSIDSLQTTIDNKSLHEVPNIQSVKENFQNLNNFGNIFNNFFLLAKENNNKYFIDWDNSKSINFKRKENINILYTPIIYNKDGKRNKSFIASIVNNNNEIESFIFSVFYDKLATNEIFSGYISKFDSSGKPIELYKYENGMLKTTYTFKKEKISSKKGYSYRDSDCGSSWEQINSAINYLLEFGGEEETIYFGECVTISSSGGGGGDNWSNPDTNLSGGFIPLGENYNTPTGGGGGSTTSTSTTTTTNNVLTAPEGLEWWVEESEFLLINRLILNLQNPTNEQIQWINYYIMTFGDSVESQNFINSAIDAINNGGSVDEVDNIINNLKGKQECVYGKLVNLNLFKETIGKFIADPNYHIQINNGECPNSLPGTRGCSNGSYIKNGLIIINISSNYGPNLLDLAQTILHEGIHAELTRYVYSVNNNIGLDSNNDRPRLMELYMEYNGLNSQSSQAQHYYMTEKYVKPIAAAIRELDNNKYPIEYYMGFGWDGLARYGLKTKMLTETQILENERLQKIVNNNTLFNYACD